MHIGVMDTQTKRIARGVRMAEDLWEFVDKEAGDKGASKVIERWVREKKMKRAA